MHRVCAKKFEQFKERRRFYDAISDPWSPEKDFVTIIGNGKIQITVQYVDVPIYKM